MKKLTIILLLFSSLAQGQGITKQFGNGYKNVNGYHYGWFNGTDTIAYFKAAGLLMKTPVLLNVWTTAGRPASPVVGMLGFNSDSTKIEWYSGGGGWQQPGAGGGGGGSSYTFSTGLTNSAGTVTANISTGVSGGQTIIGSTSTNNGLTYKTTTANGTTGADHIWVGGNNGATEFMRILNSGNVGIGNNAPAAKFVVSNGNTRLACWDGTDEYGYISTSVSSSRLQLNFVRSLSSGEDRINFTGNSYIMNDAGGSGELRIFNPFGGTFTTLYGNGTEHIRLSSSGVTMGSLAGSGTRMVTADASGVLGTQAIQTTLKGSTTWDPGSIGGNSSTSTTLTVTGAALGDGVTVSKTSGSYSNGELYFAYVSATNTVTIQLQNVSGGTFDITSATFNVIVLKH